LNRQSCKECFEDWRVGFVMFGEKEKTWIKYQSPGI